MDIMDDAGGGDNSSTAQGATTETATETTSNTPMEFDIDGVGKVKVDDIKEWKLGYMRQSDYTRKTQEVAKQRGEAKDAMEVYTFLKENPQVAQALADGDVNALKGTPISSKFKTNPQLEDVNFRLASMELDNKLTTLKAKYPDFNEVDVLTEADKLGTPDLELVFNAMRGRKVDDMKATLTKQIENELTEKIRKNGINTQTIISPNDATANTNHGLTPEQLAVAKKMRLTPEQYAKGY